MDHWIAPLERRLSKIEERLVRIGKRLERIEKEMLEDVNRRLDDFRRDLRWFMGISTVIWILIATPLLLKFLGLI